MIQAAVTLQEFHANIKQPWVRAHNDWPLQAKNTLSSLDIPHASYSHRHGWFKQKASWLAWIVAIVWDLVLRYKSKQTEWGSYKNLLLNFLLPLCLIYLGLSTQWGPKATQYHPSLQSFPDKLTCQFQSLGFQHEKNAAISGPFGPDQHPWSDGS